MDRSELVQNHDTEQGQPALTLGGAKTPNEKETIQRQIAATDEQIDQLVYELYGLTADEIRIVEGATLG